MINPSQTQAKDHCTFPSSVVESVLDGTDTVEAVASVDYYAGDDLDILRQAAVKVGGEASEELEAANEVLVFEDPQNPEMHVVLLIADHPSVAGKCAEEIQYVTTSFYVKAKVEYKELQNGV